MLLVGLVASILTLLLPQKLLATAQPDTSLDSRPTFNLFEAGLGPTPEQALTGSGFSTSGRVG